MKKKIVRSLAIDPDLWEEVKKTSNQFKISISALITIAIVEKINRMQGE